MQQQARRGHLEPCHPATLVSNGRGLRHLELLTFLVPASRGGRQALLHFLRPLPRAAAVRQRQTTRPMTTGSLSLDRLSPREMQVLRFLGSGLDAKAIAARLSIRRVTVQNHIANLLHKLGLHRRLEAVLALFGESRQARSGVGA